MKIILFMVFSILLVNFVSANSTLKVYQGHSYECAFNELVLDFDANGTIAVFSMDVFSEKLTLSGHTLGEGFFHFDNLFREIEDKIEFFDIGPNYSSGKLHFSLHNKSGGDLNPGTYDFTSKVLSQAENDSVLYRDDDFKFSFTQYTDLKNLDVKVTNKNGLENKTVMGELLNINITNLKSNLTEVLQNTYIAYHRNNYNEKTFLLSNEKNQYYPRSIETMLGDLQNNLVCPNDSFMVVFKDNCFELQIRVEQMIPKPSDIYYEVDRFFDLGEVENIPRIYYMAGAYFNCQDENASLVF